MPNKITRLHGLSNQSDGLPQSPESPTNLMANSYANASCMTDVFVGGKKHKCGTDYLAEDATIEVSDGWYFIKALGSVLWKSALHSPKLIWKQEEPQYG